MFFLKHNFLGKSEMSFSFDWDCQEKFKVKSQKSAVHK